jgi:glycosyltransferase involved in cell wall biosynthesis
MTRSALLLAYHYPPLGGVAVMRVLRFSRYLSHYGWRPIVVCVDGRSQQDLQDPALLNEVPPEVVVERVRCFEPDNYADTWEVPREKVVRNLFKLFDKALFPDDKAFWVAPVVRRVKDLVSQHRPSLIWATAQPWSTLVAGMRAKEATGLPLVLDFRDDWTTSNADFRRVKRLAQEQRLEQRVLASADAVVSVTPQIVEALKSRRPKNLKEDQFFYIPNGFDPAHFEHPPEPATLFTILHAGGLYDKRPVQPLLDVLRAWLDKRPERRSEIKVILAGRTSAGCQADIESSGLVDLIEQPGFLSHAEVRRLMMTSSVNLLMIEQVKSAPWLFTGKAFEYLGARRPILMLGPQPSLLADLLTESGLGQVSGYQNPAATAEMLETLYQNRDQSQGLSKLAKVDAYDARKQCAELAKVFQGVVGR